MDGQVKKIDTSRIKDIFSLKTEDSSNAGAQSNVEIGERFTYQQWGFKQAGKCGAAVKALEPNLMAVVNHEKQEQLKNEDVQNKHKTDLQKEIANLEGDVERKENDLHSKEKLLMFEEKKIEDCKQEIEDLKINPDKVDGDRSAKANFIIGLFIILFLTIYLFLFYSSASYSAFFKEWDINDETSLVAKVFDAKAVSEAASQSFTAVLFICLMPMIFLGLGYLVHRFTNESKKAKSKIGSYLKIGVLYILTFVFDVILAYTIESHVYDLTKTIMSPDFSFVIAFTKGGFWLIIFSGFVAYVIWGLVFDFFMDAYYNLDKVKVRIDILEQKIKEYKVECKNYKLQIDTLNNEISVLRAKIKEKNIELLAPIIKPLGIVEAINNFVAGWLNYMTGLAMPLEAQTQARNIADCIITDLNQRMLQIVE